MPLPARRDAAPGAADQASKPVFVIDAGLNALFSNRGAAELANHAAGVVVGKLGAASVQPRELLEAMKNHHE